jgi:hypothetical protein
MASFMDFLKGIGGAISSDVQQSHGGFGNFVEGLAQGVQDKFTGVTPQQREELRLRRQEAEQEALDEQVRIREQAKRDEATHSFRTQSLEDRDLDRELRDKSHEETLAFRKAQMEAQSIRDAEAIMRRQAEREADKTFRTTEREAAERFRADEARKGEAFREEMREKAVAAANVFQPTVKYADVAFSKLTGEPLPKDEANRRFAEVAQAEFEAWQHRNSLSSGVPVPDDPISKAEAVRDEGVANATEDAQEPGADQNEVDEAEARKNDAIADFDRFFGGDSGAGLQTHEPGDRALFGATAGGGSPDPAFIEQDVSEQGIQQKAQEEIAEFRALVTRVAEDDGDAAVQLGEIVSPENIRAFKLLAEDYGPEALNQLRLIYRQTLKTDPPF